MSFDDASRDRKTDSHAVTVGLATFESAEQMEGFLQIVVGDAPASVLHEYRRFAVAPGVSDTDVCRRAAVLDGVVNRCFDVTSPDYS